MTPATGKACGVPHAPSIAGGMGATTASAMRPWKNATRKREAISACGFPLLQLQEEPVADNGVAALREDLTRSLLGGPWGEAAAVVVLLDFKPIAGNPRFARHADRGGVHWDAVLAENWSASERFLIATAAGLWGGRAYGADVSWVPFLGDDFFAVWQAMVTASRTGKAPG